MTTARRILLVLWVLGSIARCAGHGERPASWLVDVTDEVGLDFVHETGARGGYHLPEIMGAGAALFDFDGDGNLDVYLTNGNFQLSGEGARAAPGSRLYRQEADGTFEDKTADAGLGDAGYGMGVAVGDMDNDGDLDVYLANFGPSKLYRNRGDGTFEDRTAAAGIEVPGFATSAVFCDYDLDGFLDLYVARYVHYDARRVCHDSAGRRDYCTPIGYEAEPDVLLHNRGDGTFADVTRAAGLEHSVAAGLGVVCDDFDENGLPDFYVANDKYPNALWLNQGGGVFEDEALLRGAALNLTGRTSAGMGVAAADLDGDLDVDLYVTNLETEANTLYRNRGKGLFEDATAAFGLVESTVPWTGFGVVALDVELDGDLDLFVANGRVLRRVEPAGVPSDFFGAYAEHNLFLLNNGGRFDSRSDLAAEFTGPLAVSRALAAGDVDNDGDLDLLVASVQSRARLFRNEAPRRGSWLLVRAFDPRLRRDAIGARLTLETAGRRQVRTVSAGSSYLSSHDARAHFGLGDATRVERLEVRWPDGLLERFEVPAVNREIRLVRGSGVALS